MKIVLLTCLVAAFAAVECVHTFLGSNVLRPMVYHQNVHYSSKAFRKRVENLYFMMPSEPFNTGRSIQGILAYDQTDSGASANVTQGGIGFNFVNLRMKSDRGMKLHFDIYVYA